MVKAVVSAPYRATTVAAISLVSLIAFETMAIATAMPAAAQALDGLSYYGVAFGATIATAIIGMVIAGIWCDRGGLFGPMASGILFMVAGLFTAGVAGDMGMLIAGRILQGVGFGLLQVSLYVLIGRRYPAALRPPMFAALSTAWAVPALVGPPIAGLIADHLGWRWVFLGVPLLGIPAAVIVISQARDLRRSRARDDDAGASTIGQGGTAARIAWAFVAAGGAGLLNVGGQTTGSLRLALVAVGLISVAVAATRLLTPGATRFRHGLPSVIALRGVAAAAFFSVEVYIPLLLIREHGLSPPVAGFILGCGTLGWTVGAWVQSRMSKSAKFTPAARLRGSFTIMAVGLAVATLTSWPGTTPLIAVLGWTVAGLGMGMTFPTLAVLLFDFSPPEHQGRDSASLQLADALATGTAFAVSGAAFAALIATQTTLAYVVVIGAAALVAAVGAIRANRVAPG